MPTQLTVVVPWQTGGIYSLHVPQTNGTNRVFHAIKSAPKQGGIEHPDIEIWFLAEYNAATGKYNAPPELPATAIYGAPAGYTGYRIAGVKHGSIELRIREHDEDGNPAAQVQVLLTTRLVEGGPFIGAIVGFPELPVDEERLPLRLAARITALEELSDEYEANEPVRPQLPKVYPY